ncbi:MAG: Stk1 family PASTA domain-containing Ser/Thr kinase [Lachnospiraceae bacterium]|nr:Stk1 family PASTA domain-containing Ser/Thr kinase [Lachnospiraceae bacterium]
MLKTGAVINERYEVVGRIGSGGMADVYKAKDHKLNRNVAVKVMKTEFNNDDSFVRKFRREAQAAAGLANPNIVSVFDVGEDNGLYYIVMELVEGITLKEYIAKKQKLSVREATSIAIQVSMGLAAAHAQGIVHRDIKPQNIIISTDGKVKVTDFGIARAASSNTISANVMGSVHYSSPEQVRGGYSDAKSDIYSLGISLYEMVTGRVPFDGETTVAIAIKHLQDEMDPPSKYTPDLPYSLEQIIYKCTQKSPDRRYDSVNDLIADLKHSLTDPNGHFVTLTPLADHAATVQISNAELAAIKAGSVRPASGRDDRDGRDGRRRAYVDPDDDDIYDDEEDNGGISAKLEKAMTIGGLVVGALIICILIFFIGRAAGLFKTGGNDPSSSGSPASSEASVIREDMITVPYLLGMTREQAQAAVSTMSIGIKYAGEIASEEYPAGQICKQDPEPETEVARNSTVYFYVSSGKPQIAIPAVIGEKSEDAREMLREAGFTNVRENREESTEFALGRVISVSPTVGAMTDSSTEIVLTVSSGAPTTSSGTASSESSPSVDPNATPVVLRSLRGLTQEEATTILERYGFRIKIDYGYTTDIGFGEVMMTSYTPGEAYMPGTEITLTINSKEYKESSDAAASASSAASSASSASSQASGSYWSTDVLLGETPEYHGGAYRLTLVQNVGGSNQETTVAEGSKLSFPYEFRYSKGAPGVSSGDVYLYEVVDGNYVRKAKWPVTFEP